MSPLKNILMRIDRKSKKELGSGYGMNLALSIIPYAVLTKVLSVKSICSIFQLSIALSLIEFSPNTMLHIKLRSQKNLT